MFDNKFSKNNIFILFKFLSAKRKSQLFLVLMLMLFTSLTEVISIGSIYPFLSIIFSGNSLIPSNDYVNLSNLSQNFFLYFFILMVLLAGVMRMLLIVIQTTIGHEIGIDFGKQSIKNILHQPYNIQITINRGEVISVIANKISDTVNYIIISTLNIISTIITAVFIFFFLLIVDIKVSLILVFIFLILYLSAVLIVKDKMYTNGIVWSNHQVLVLNSLREALNSLRELKIFRMENYYINFFSKKYSELRRAQAQNQILSQIPKNLIEILAILAFAMFLIFYNNSSNSNDLSNIIPLIGTFAMAGSRLLPSFQNIYRSWSNMRAGKKVLNDVIEIMDKQTNIINYKLHLKKISFKNTIELSNLSFAYNNHKNVLENINLSFNKNSLNCIVGKSGSGKSTIVDIISTLIMPINGYLKIDNKILNYKNSKNWMASISYLSQDFFLKNSSIKENIAYGEKSEKISQKKLIQSSKKANIYDFIVSLKNGFDTNIGEKGVNISGGEKQRIALARAYYRESDLLILDEFTSALDKNNSISIIKNLLILKKSMTIIMITHDKSLLKYCDSVYEIKNKKIEKLK